jgi:hypothetical protein
MACATAPQGEVMDAELKKEMAAWSKAIMLLDPSEVIARDLIERDLAGAKLMPIAQILAVTNKLVAKIKPIRAAAIKAAFTLLRTRLVDKRAGGMSFAKWAKTFADSDLLAIRQAIETGISAGDDSTEIARRVVGSMAKNGCDGVTEITRHRLAWLAQTSIKGDDNG